MSFENRDDLLNLADIAEKITWLLNARLRMPGLSSDRSRPRVPGNEARSTQRLLILSVKSLAIAALPLEWAI